MLWTWGRKKMLWTWAETHFGAKANVLSRGQFRRKKGVNCVPGSNVQKMISSSEQKHKKF